MTSKRKNGKFYLFIDFEDKITRMAILSQLRLIDTKRLYQKIGVIDKTVHKKLELEIIKLCKGF